MRILALEVDDILESENQDILIKSGDVRLFLSQENAIFLSKRLNTIFALQHRNGTFPGDEIQIVDDSVS